MATWTKAKQHSRRIFNQNFDAFETDTYLGLSKTSKMKKLAKMINSWMPLTVAEKRS